MERFDRLLAEQQQAIEQTDKKINQLQKFSDDYASLKPKLDSLSKCFTKQTIIPFSPRALVPAQLIHTNEVLVHLGGSAEHFCEVSTFQALSFIDKRIDRLEADIAKLREQRKLLTDRETFTRRLHDGEAPCHINDSVADEKEFEIREEFDPTAEEEWLASHKKRVQVERRKEREAAAAATLPDMRSTDEKVVRFACDGEESDSGSSTSSYLPDICFINSSLQPRPVSADISNWSKASPADVVAYIEKHHSRSILKNATCMPASTGPTTAADDAPVVRNVRASPFCDVVEHSEPESGKQPRHSETKSQNVSRFRSLRSQRD